VKGIKQMVVTILLLVVTTIAWADVIYLKNGSVIKGKIIEMKPQESYKIETADGNIFVFEMEEIEKVVFREEEKVIPKKPVSKIKFSMAPFLGNWEPKDIGIDKEMLYGLSLRWMTEENVALQFEFGFWDWEDKKYLVHTRECTLLVLSGLHFTTPPNVTIPMKWFFGGGIGFYIWDMIDYAGKDEDDTAIGFHICGGVEFSPGENFSFGIELRQIMGKADLYDEKSKFNDLMPMGKLIFTF
jgi:hypothetical protein